MQSVGRRRFRRLVATVAGMSGVRWLHERRARRVLTVLMYHRILPRAQARDYPFESLVVTEDVFEAQVDWLAENARCVTLREALQEAEAPSSARGRPLVAITFDDGYWDNAEVAAPILDRAQARGTFFVTTSFIEGDPLWFDRAATLFSSLQPPIIEEALRPVFERRDCEAPTARKGLGGWMESLKKAPSEDRLSAIAALEALGEAVTPDPGACRPMTVAQLRDLQCRGHEIGSHTVTHPILPGLTESALEDELRESKATLESWVGSPVEGLCYPNGDFDDQTLSVARRAGYRYACSTQGGFHAPQSDDPFQIRRRMISQGNSTDSIGHADVSIFRAEVAGVFQTLRETVS